MSGTRGGAWQNALSGYGLPQAGGLQLRLRVVADEAVDEADTSEMTMEATKGAAKLAMKPAPEQPLASHAAIEQKRVHHEIEDAQGEHGHRQRRICRIGLMDMLMSDRMSAKNTMPTRMRCCSRSRCRHEPTAAATEMAVTIQRMMKFISALLFLWPHYVKMRP